MDYIINIIVYRRFICTDIFNKQGSGSSGYCLPGFFTKAEGTENRGTEYKHRAEGIRLFPPSILAGSFPALFEAYRLKK